MKRIYMLMAAGALLAGCSPQGDQGASGSASSSSTESSNVRAGERGQPSSEPGSVDIYTNQATRAGTTGADTQSGAQGNGSQGKSSIAR